MKTGTAFKVTALGALAAMLLTTAAWAITNPSLSITAVKNGQKVKATGTYTPNGVDCQPAGGKGVTLFVNNLNSGGTTTDGGGDYLVQSSNLAPGTYSVFTFVLGDMSGTYGAPAICNNAMSTTESVTI